MSRALFVTGLLAGALALMPGCVVVTDFGAFHAADAEVPDGPVPDGGGLDAGPRDGGTGDGGPIDGGPRDASGEDAGPCGGTCGEGEACCDGACVDIRSSLAHCGGCGMACEGGPHQSAACVDFACELTCDPTWDDCSAEAGCETALTTPSDCGACGAACPGGEICGAVDDVYDCRTTCSPGETNCGGTCAHLGTDPRHCRSCDVVCDERPGAAEGCGASGCAYTCDLGRADCNGDLMTAAGDGCETLLVVQYPDADGDGYGSMLAPGSMRCPGTGYSSNRTDCDDTTAARSPGLTETCDGIDNDCDGRIDDDFMLGGVARTVGDDCTCEAGAAAARIVCAGPSAVRCAYPAEACNGWDDDCSGGADDTFSCVRGSTTTCTGTGTASGCTFAGTRTCGSGCTLGGCVAPAETCDGVDEDCNGFADEGTVPFGSPIAVTSYPSVSQVRGAWVGGSVGGAVVASSSGTEEQLLFARFDASGAPVGTPILIATHPMYAVIGDVGWDGTQWLVLYSWFDSSRGVTSILRAHVSAAGDAVRYGSITDAESVAIVRNASGTGLGVVTARYVGTSGVGMQYGVYASGAFTRPLSFLTTAPILSRAHVVAAGGGAFYAVGSDMTGVFFQRFDATGTLDVLYRPVVAASTDVFGAAHDGTNLLVLYRDGSDVRLRAVSSIGTTRWTTMLRSSGFQGPVGMVGTEAWASLSDGTAFRVRTTDGTVFPESYPRYCEAFVATPDGPSRGFCASGGSLIPIDRCP